MGDKTKIDWCDATWNPVTGCRHGCKYCYARGLTERFGGMYGADKGNALSELYEPYRRQVDGRINPYPYGFMPTFHRYMLDRPQQWKHPRTIFVCSMADLFGEWVPDEWIDNVFDACTEAPQHRYLFLTKNPTRYLQLKKDGKIPVSIDCWWGTTTTHTDDPFAVGYKTFISVEPIMEDFSETKTPSVGWVIIGAETGNRKGKVVPRKEWILPFADRCRAEMIPVFMKESLRGIMGEDFRQEFPWEDE